MFFTRFKGDNSTEADLRAGLANIKVSFRNEMDGIRKEKDQLLAEIQGMMAKKVELTNQLFSLKEHIQKAEAERNSGNNGIVVTPRERAGSNGSVKRIPAPINISLDRVSTVSSTGASPLGSNSNLNHRASPTVHSPGIPKSATTNSMHNHHHHFHPEGILKKTHKRSPSATSLKDSMSATSGSTSGISAVDDFDDLDELLKLTDNILVKKKSKDLSIFLEGSGGDYSPTSSPQAANNSSNGSNGSLLSLVKQFSPTINIMKSPLSPVNKMVAKLYHKSDDQVNNNTKSKFTTSGE